MTEKIHIWDTGLSDFHKDAYGFRPRGHYQEWWTQEELDAEYDRLSALCEENRVREEAQEKQALVEFEELIKETIANGAADRQTAIRWLMQAEGVNVNSSQDVEYFFWLNNLGWEKIDEFKKPYIDKAKGLV